MRIFPRLRRWIAQQQPGSVANVAMLKRQYETELLDAGYSRTAAKVESARRYGKHD